MGLVMKLKFTDIIRENTLKNYYVNGSVCGFQFDVRLGYYRGHYLSVIDELGVIVDGETFSKQEITFCLNGKEFGITELKHQVSEFWTILTPATIMVRKSGGLSSGEHEIDFKLMLRSPYMPLPGASEAHAYTPIDSCEKKKVMLNKDVSCALSEAKGVGVK